MILLSFRVGEVVGVGVEVLGKRLVVPYNVETVQFFPRASLGWIIFSFMCMFCRSLFVLVLFLFAIVLSVLRYTDSDYPFGVFKHFFIKIQRWCVHSLNQHMTSGFMIGSILMSMVLVSWVFFLIRSVVIHVYDAHE